MLTHLRAKSGDQEIINGILLEQGHNGGTLMSKKIFDGVGYDQEEHYFHKLNLELVKSQRSKSESREVRKDNVLEFKPRNQAAAKKSGRKAA